MDREEMKIKKEFAKYISDLKRKATTTELTRQTTVISLKELIKTEQITTGELKKLWNNGKKMFSL